MSRPTSSASYPQTMLELLLRVGSSKKAVPMKLPSVEDCHDVRNKFYGLRTALKREKYSEVDTVMAVRMRLIEATSTLIFESTERMAKASHEDALQNTLALLDEADSQQDATNNFPLSNLPVVAPAADAVDADEAALAELANNPNNPPVLGAKAAGMFAELAVEPTNQPTPGAINVQSIPQAS